MREARAWECFLLWKRPNLSNEITQLSQPDKPALLPKSSSAGLAALFSISCPICVIHVNFLQTTFDTCFSSQKLVKKGKGEGYVSRFLHTYASVDISRSTCAASPWLTCGRAIYKWCFLRPLGGNIYFFLFLSAR